MKKFWHFIKIKKRWFITALVLFIVGFGIYMKFDDDDNTIRYVTAAAEKGTLISTISGTGQVSAANQLDIKSKVSGDVVLVGQVTVGQAIKTGTLLFQLNAREALKTVRDAEVSLASARLSLQKLQQAADPLTVLQAEHALTQAQENKQNAIANVQDAFEDSLNAVANAFLDLPTIITNLNDILYSKDIGESEPSVGTSFWNVDALLNTVGGYEYVNILQISQQIATNDYSAARLKYDANFDHYKIVSRYSDNQTVEALLDETIDTVRALSQSAKSSSNYLDTWVDMRTQQSYSIFTKVSSHQNTLSSCIGQINGHLSSLLAIQRTLQDNRAAIIVAERTIAEKTEALKDIKDGADPLDLAAQLIAVQQKENALADAREKLADYTIRAPFDGVIAAFNVKKGDALSANVSVGTLITKQQMAIIALNEVDVAQVQIGQKVTLVFDAIEGLSLTGNVAEIDALGTVSQGVVSYNVKILFNTDDDRIKAGMTVTANIILSAKTDVLLVKTGAIKKQNNLNYVEVLVNGVPEKRNIETGDSNDTMTEIINGLAVGEIVVNQTITTASKGNTGGQSNMPGGGEMMRMMR